MLLATGFTTPAGSGALVWRPTIDKLHIWVAYTTNWSVSNGTFGSITETYDLGSGGGGSGGDPYCTPIYGTPTKLPGKCATYRMFESGDCFINASVSEATEEDKYKMVKFLQKNNYSQDVIDHMIYDGFFYDTFFFTTGNASGRIDLNTLEIVYENKEAFTIVKEDITHPLSMYNRDNHKFGVQLKHTFQHKIHGKTDIMIQIYNNPQIKNGIHIQLEKNAHVATGLLVYNYKPKYMVIPTIKTLKHKTLHRKLNKADNKGKNVFKNNENIKKNEVWVNSSMIKI